MRHLVTFLTFFLALGAVHAQSCGSVTNGCHILAYCTTGPSPACECQMGTIDLTPSNPGQSCQATGYAVRYVLNGAVANFTTFTNANVIGTGLYCPSTAQGWFMKSIDRQLTTGVSGSFTEVYCIYLTEAAATIVTPFGTTFGGYTVTSGPGIYRYVLPTTSAAVEIPPTGMEVDNVQFDIGCATSGCWVITGTVTTGENLLDNNAFNSFYLPHAVGNDALSSDFNYAAGGNGVGNNVPVEWTFQPVNHPCTSVQFSASTGNTQEVTTCCITNPGIGQTGGTSSTKGGFLANYRPTGAFYTWATTSLAVCSGVTGAQVIQSPAYTGTDPYNVSFPTGAVSFLSPGKFTGMPDSPGVVKLDIKDPFFAQYDFEIRLDEVELRRKAGKLRGTVGVEHTVDTFLGLANFRATGFVALDTFATQVAIHLEKTSFFSVSTHGTNDYTFLEYVNMRLVAIYLEDKDFSGTSESSAETVRTSKTAAAHYVQVTFTLGSKYGVNTNSGLIPRDSVRAGKGTFFDSAELKHKCDEYAADGSQSTTWDDVLANKATFVSRLAQSCAPAVDMCASPASIPDSFVAYNIPLGIDFYGAPSSTLSNNVFVDMVISAVDNDAKEAAMTSPAEDNPNDGAAPWQMKTTLTGSIPVVEGGVNIFCDGFTAKTDLKDVANVDIVVGSASNAAELTRLRIKKDIASSQLAPNAVTEINSDSIEGGLMTLVLKGNASYFLTNSGRALVSLELEDVITIHIMQSDGSGADTDVSTSVSALLTAAPTDNSDTNGIDTDGYPLNSAFYFTIDRSAQRAHLEPSTALLAICPFNPPRPAGATPLETCVSRRDVRYRDFPARTGAMSTAMEICKEGTCPTMPAGTAAHTSDEAKFFVTIFGNNEYAKDLAVDFASVIKARYSLNGRYVRAYWINPGYEWTPTQTGGTSLFSISQKLYLFALVTLDEGIATDDGKTIGSNPGPFLPTLRRRMLLQATTAEQLKDGQATVSGEAFEFTSTPTSIMANAFNVPVDRVATFAVKLQLTQAEACMGEYELQSAIRSTFEDYLATSASEMHTVQVTKLSVNKAGVQCRRSLRSLLTSFSAASAEVTMLVVFKEGTVSTFSLEKFRTMSGIQSVDVLEVSSKVNVEAPVTYVPPPPSSSSDESSSSKVGLIAGVAGGVGGAVLVGIIALVVMFSRRSSQPEPVVGAIQTINIDKLKEQLSQDV